MKTFVYSVALVAALALVRPAHADDEASREADMFGEAAESTPAAPAGPAENRDDEMFGGDEPATTAPAAPSAAADSGVGELEVIDTNAMSSRIEDTNDKLALGARLFSQYSYQALEKGEWETFRLSSPNLLDVYLDGRPNERVRLYARGRLTYNPTAGITPQGVQQQSLVAQLDQLWLKFDAAKRVFFTIGRQRIKWGASRFWNPTDFMNQAVLDPLAPVDLRLGATLLKVHVPVSIEAADENGTNVTMNFYGIVDLQNVSNAGGVGGGLRAEVAAGPAEVALTASAKKNTPLRLGADLSAAVGLFDVRAEAAVLHPDAAGVVRRYVGEFDIGTLPPSLPKAIDRKGEWIPQLVLGFDTQLMYSEDDSVILGAEYFFNDLGYADAAQLPMLLFGSRLPNYPTPVQGTAFSPLYNGRHYVALMVMLSRPGSWNDTTFSISSINSLGRMFDEGVAFKDAGVNGVARFNLSQTILTNLSLNAWVSAYYGDTGEFRFRFQLDPVPFVEGLENGIDIPASSFEAGFGFTLNI